MYCEDNKKLGVANKYYFNSNSRYLENSKIVRYKNFEIEVIPNTKVLLNDIKKDVLWKKLKDF